MKSRTIKVEKKFDATKLVIKIDLYFTWKMLWSVLTETKLQIGRKEILENTGEAQKGKDVTEKKYFQYYCQTRDFK